MKEIVVCEEIKSNTFDFNTLKNITKESNKSGIYIILNNIDGKVYVGSSVNI